MLVGLAQPPLTMQQARLSLVQGAHAAGLRKRTQVVQSVVNSLIAGEGFGHLFQCVSPLNYGAGLLFGGLHREQNL
jgi:hypothetical protein